MCRGWDEFGEAQSGGLRGFPLGGQVGAARGRVAAGLERAEGGRAKSRLYAGEVRVARPGGDQRAG